MCRPAHGGVSYRLLIPQKASWSHRRPLASAHFPNHETSVNRRFLVLGGWSTLAVAAATSLSAQQKCPATTGARMPLTYKGGPTVAAITPCDLMTREYIYAADSMRGREAGTPD